MSKVSKFIFWHYLHPRYWSNWLGLLVMLIISLLPFRVIVFLGSLLGKLLFMFSRSRKHIVLRNLERCFPQWNNEQRLKIARQNFIATGRAFVETSIAWWLPAQRLQSLMNSRGEHHIDQAVAENKRIILLIGHFCSLEMAAMYFASARTVVTIYKPPHNKLMDAFIRNRRLRYGMGTLLRVSDGLKPAIRALKRGEIFIYLPDQNAGRRNGMFVPFFGIQASTFSVLGKMTKLTDAVVLPCYIRQLPAGQGYELTIEPPLDNFPSGDDYQDTLRVNTEIEKEVKEIPDQYLWVHRRFKTRPEGEKEFY
ncbi:MAG: lysophospholipid acyltransferase family protein [Acidiferrobacterales bacterium]